jgi:hypothetical protein
MTARDLLYGLVLEDGRRWGRLRSPSSATTPNAVLDEGSLTPYHWLARARG